MEAGHVLPEPPETQVIRGERIKAAQHLTILAVGTCLALGCANLRLPAIDPSGRRIFLPRPAYTTVNEAPANGFFPEPAFSAPPPPQACYPDQGYAAGAEFDEPGLPLCQRNGTLLDRLLGPAEYEQPCAPVHIAVPVYSACPPLAAECLPICPPYDPCQVVPFDPCLTTVPCPPNLPYAQQVAPLSQQTPAVVPLAPPPVINAAPAPAIPPDGRFRAPASTRGQFAAHLQLNPARLVAPVGREVILQAGLCGDDGYLIKKQPIEWSLSQDSVGSFVEVDAFDRSFWQRLTRRTPRKKSGSYAIGRTSTRAQVLTRGTAAANDDILLAEGQTWISVTSAAEGVSHVSAVAPTAVGWAERRKTATIHWVDGQWTFPPPSLADVGTSQRITTNVTRASSGGPILGWIVRYEILDGTAAASAGRVLDVPTDAAGNATVEVTPLNGQPGVTQIQIQVIRVGQPGDLERFVVGEGTTTITWTTVAGTPPNTFAPPSTNPPPRTTAPPPTTVPAPTIPTPAIPIPSLTTPQPSNVQPPAPQNNLRVAISGPETARTGERVLFTITITNLSNEPLTQVLLRDQFDSGLGHVQGSSPIEWPTNLGAGEARELPLRFTILNPGQHCHTVTVTSGDGSRATARACIQATADAGGGTPPPGGDPFDARQNQGASLDADPPVRRANSSIKPSHHAHSQNTTEREPAFANRELRARDRSPVPAINDVATHRSTQLGPEPAAQWAENAATKPKAAGLRVTVADLGDPARVNERLTYVVMIHNDRDVSDRDVVLTITLPAGARFETSINPPMIRARNATPDRRTVEFLPLAELRAGESATYRIVATSRKTGTGTFLAEVTSARSSTPATASENTSFFAQ